MVCKGQPGKRLKQFTIYRSPQCNMRFCHSGWGCGGAITFMSPSLALAHTHTRHATLWGYTVSFLQKRTRTRHATQLGSSLALADAHHATQCGSSLALAHRHTHTHTHAHAHAHARAHAHTRARHASQLGSSLALAHTSHAMLWGSSLALTHASCYAMGIFSGTCAHTHTRHAAEETTRVSINVKPEKV